LRLPEDALGKSLLEAVGLSVLASLLQGHLAISTLGCD